MEEKEITLKTEAVNEILSAPPVWIVRFGISIVFLLIVLFVALSAVIRYPDKMTGKATLTTNNPTVILVPKLSAKISSLLIKNNQLVDIGEVLAVLENTASYTDVLKIDSLVNQLSERVNRSDSIDLELIGKFGTDFNLGTVTGDYLKLLGSLKDYALFTQTNPQQREIRLLNADLLEYKQLLTKYQEQISIAEQEFKLVDKDFLRDEVLYGNKVISAKEFEDRKRAFLQAKKNYEGQKIILSNTNITVNNTEKSILQLQIQHFEQQSKQRGAIQANLQGLQTSLKDWQQNYLIKSPIKGTVSFYGVWSVNQSIKAGEEMFSVIPDQKQDIVAKMLLPVSNSGKVKIGQQVNVKLSDFPFTEYGMLNGTVKAISQVPNKGNYMVDIVLPHGMKTSYNKTLKYKPEMEAQAEIITDNKTVLQRIFRNFNELINF
jgi:multidrug resistance efflux pump